MKIVRSVLALAVVAAALLLGAAAFDRSSPQPPTVRAIELSPDRGGREGEQRGRPGGQEEPRRERDQRRGPDGDGADEVPSPAPVPAGGDDDAPDDDADDEGSDDGDD
ncbi:MAG TPA: hypothetical protein VHF23_09265 [Gaiellaceae bacterium]|nr:hypothetical protein [Gaiellaceae bacterium]